MTTRNTNETEILNIVNHHLHEQFTDANIQLHKNWVLTYIAITTPTATTTIIHVHNQTINSLTRTQGTNGLQETKSIDLNNPNSLNELSEMINKLHKIND